MYRKTIILIIGLLAMHGARAQSARKLTLSEAMELGVTNSKQLTLSEGKVKEAQAKVAQARDQAWPELSVSASYLRINQPHVKLANESSSSSGSSPLAGLSSISSIGLAQASLSVPLFAGFKTHNNKLMAEYLEQAAQYDALTSKEEVKLNTAKAFYQYYELLETRKVITENLSQEEQRVKEFKNLEAQQLLARNDRLKAELQVNNVKLTLTEINNNVKLVEYNLIILLGLPSETTLEVDTAGMFTRVKLSAWDEYLQRGLENKNDLKSLQYQSQASEVGYKMAKANRYPTLALTGGYINAYIPNFITVTNAVNGGISFKYSITGAIHASHAMKEASARQQQVEASKQMLSDEISLEIRQKYLKYQETVEKLAITETAIEQAQENYQITQNKYKNGLVILSDYLDADVMLLQARINYATTKADSMIAYFELQESTGNLQ